MVECGIEEFSSFAVEKRVLHSLPSNQPMLAKVVRSVVVVLGKHTFK